jgi:hypothetical protein
LLRRITFGLLNNGSSAIEPKRSADDREAAQTSPLVLIITVMSVVRREGSAAIVF